VIAVLAAAEQTAGGIAFLQKLAQILPPLCCGGTDLGSGHDLGAVVVKGIDEITFKKQRNLCGRIRRMLISSCKTLKEKIKK
jgi:hypothetical protein